MGGKRRDCKRHKEKMVGGPEYEKDDFFKTLGPCVAPPQGEKGGLVGYREAGRGKNSGKGEREKKERSTEG